MSITSGVLIAKTGISYPPFSAYFLSLFPIPSPNFVCEIFLIYFILGKYAIFPIIGMAITTLGMG
jgi:hypothetical protein